MQQQVQVLHSASVDEETGLRGFLATGSIQFLQPYGAAVPQVSAAEQALRNEHLSAALSADLVAMQVAQQRWFDEWARRAADPSEAAATGAAPNGPAEQAKLTAFLGEGKSLFDAYRDAETTFANDIRAQLAQADDDQSDWFL